MTIDRHPTLPDAIKAPRTDAIYNCHSYLTKVPVGAIIPFIEAYTRPGDTVADVFAGSGMTGVAARILGRGAQLSDISRLGQHIGRGYLTEVEPSSLRADARQVVVEARARIGALYTTPRASDGQAVEMMRTIWSFVYACPVCEKDFVYYDRVINADEDQCTCGTPFVKREWARRPDLPRVVVVKGPDGILVEQPICDDDFQKIKSASEDDRTNLVPDLPISPEREMYRRSALRKHGLTSTAKFFTPRNALVLLELSQCIAEVEDEALRRKLLFAFTAILPRASRRYQWGPLRPLNAQNQTYYIAPIYFEWNVFDLYVRKIEAVIRSDELIFRRSMFEASGADPRPVVQYTVASAHELGHIEDESVDYIFTDPPFGSNIFYSDMNLFQEAWLGQVTDHSDEAVIQTGGERKGDAARRYELLLEGAFKEAGRILRPDAYMSVVFGNSSGLVWGLVQRALRTAEFSAPVHVAILDKGQRSVKGLNSGSEGVATVDLVLTVQKSQREVGAELEPANVEELIGLALAQVDSEHAGNPSYVYVAAVREAIRRHQKVDGLHLSEVLIALRRAGYSLDPRTGLLRRGGDRGTKKEPATIAARLL